MEMDRGAELTRRSARRGPEKAWKRCCECGRDGDGAQAGRQVAKAKFR